MVIVNNKEQNNANLDVLHECIKNGVNFIPASG